MNTKIELADAIVILHKGGKVQYTLDFGDGLPGFTQTLNGWIDAGKLANILSSLDENESVTFWKI